MAVKCGNEASLQRIFWDGKTTAADMQRVSVTSSGFEVFFTTPLAESLAPADVLAKVKVESWTYTDTSRYGSDEDDKHPDAVTNAAISADRKSLKFEVQSFSTPAALNRIYWIQIAGARHLFPPGITHEKLEAYYTVRAVPH